MRQSNTATVDNFVPVDQLAHLDTSEEVAVRVLHSSDPMIAAMQATSDEGRNLTRVIQRRPPWKLPNPDLRLPRRRH